MPRQSFSVGVPIFSRAIHLTFFIFQLNIKPKSVVISQSRGSKSLNATPLLEYWKNPELKAPTNG